MDMTPVPLAGRMVNLRSNAIRELLAITQRPDVISMAGGLPRPMRSRRRDPTVTAIAAR
jgi:2-aminoadipate transaminase